MLQQVAPSPALLAPTHILHVDRSHGHAWHRAIVEPTARQAGPAPPRPQPLNFNLVPATNILATSSTSIVFLVYHSIMSTSSSARRLRARATETN